jgi:alkylation response protein AidB-like acyl-CoA dehydrogenase
MRFAFTDDQVAFADAVRDLLAKECPPEVVREAWTSETGRLPSLWSQLAEMGVVGMLAPEPSGGMGLADVDLVRILAEAGRAGLTEPLADVAAVAVPTIRDHAETGAAAELLGRIAAGDATVGVGLASDGSVLHAATADAFLLEADDGMHLVDASAVELSPLASIDGSRRLARVLWHPTAATRLSGGEGTAGDARDRAAVAAAAELCGLADRMLEITVAYVGERRQFGVPIGSFQAVKHHLANALLALEFAKPLVWRAAYSQSVGDGRASLHASMAKAQASDAAEAVGAAALQCHGAIGYTVECDLHLFLKRTWALARRAGDAAHHRRRVAAAIL